MLQKQSIWNGMALPKQAFKNTTQQEKCSTFYSKK